MKTVTTMVAAAAFVCMGLSGRAAQAQTWYGTEEGTEQDCSETPDAGASNPLTSIHGWSDAEHIYGLHLFYEDGTVCKLGPASPHGSETTLTPSPGKVFQEIDVYVDGNSILRGIIAYTNEDTNIQWGLVTSSVTAFSGDTLTGIDAYEYQLTYKTLVAMSFSYLSGIQGDTTASNRTTNGTTNAVAPADTTSGDFFLKLADGKAVLDEAEARAPWRDLTSRAWSYLDRSTKDDRTAGSSIGAWLWKSGT
jgi:hypothetical protein